ncbi:hypothetical protein QVD17_29122 [Tagetes erecta]|uniref:Uncharacterized protein n=1 Tax=Tagetes erecta TaxID=13708 RepID=A0AAD8KG27_TARER|nr:hypothetical protein QVD17_29122 [Tagetes erecta]
MLYTRRQLGHASSAGPSPIGCVLQSNQNTKPLPLRCGYIKISNWGLTTIIDSKKLNHQRLQIDTSHQSSSLPVSNHPIRSIKHQQLIRLIQEVTKSRTIRVSFVS